MDGLLNEPKFLGSFKQSFNYFLNMFFEISIKNYTSPEKVGRDHSFFNKKSKNGLNFEPKYLGSNEFLVDF